MAIHRTIAIGDRIRVIVKDGMPSYLAAHVGMIGTVVGFKSPGGVSHCVVRFAGGAEEIFLPEYLEVLG